MAYLVQVVTLSACLLWVLVRPGPSPRMGTRSRYQPTGAAAVPFAVLFGSWLLIAPTALLIEQERVRFAGSWWHMALVAAAPFAAYGLVRVVAPERSKRRHLVMGARAAGLVVLVPLVEVVALSRGVPVNSSMALFPVAIVTTAGYLACLRTIDLAYWPLALVQDGVLSAVVVAAIGWWSGAVLPDATGYLLPLLFWALLAVAVTRLAVGGVRSARWLRTGPGMWPAPPGARNWPPSDGEVWSALVTHDDDNYKDRPVLVLHAEPHAVHVLNMTSQDKTGSPHHLRLKPADWEGVLSRTGFLSLDVTRIPYSDFRLYRGESTDRFWKALLSNKRVRERERTTPFPGFARRHLLASARNRHVGRNEGAPPATRRGTPQRSR